MNLEKYKQAISQLSVSDDKILSTATKMDVALPIGENSNEILKFTIINKNISTPIGMKDILLQGDVFSRRIFFEMSRYFDGIDLSDKKYFINFINAKNQSGTDDITDIYVSDDLITLEWWVPSQVTILDGEVTIQLEISEFSSNGSIIYRFLTIPLPLYVHRSVNPNGTMEQNDYYLDIRFMNKYSEDILYNIASDIEPIQIESRSIVMPYMEDCVVTQDTRSRCLSFVISRFFDNIDLSDKTVAIKFELPDGRGDRAFACNTKVSDTQIRFDWLIDGRVTPLEGRVTFSIEFIGYNEKNEFTCWNTLPASFLVSKGLDVDSDMEAPSPSWLQSWNIIADKYLRNFLKHMDMIKNLADRMETLADEVETAKSKAEAAASTAKVWSNIAWNQADRADQIKTEVILLKVDFDSKYKDFTSKYTTFTNELPNLRKKDEKIEYSDLAAALASYLDSKSNNGHTHDVSEIKNARSTKDPITEDDLAMELLELIGSGGGDGSGSGISLSNIFNDKIVSQNKGWTSNYINSLIEEIKENYVEKDGGQGLSDNNFTDYYRKKLDGIEENANYFDAFSLQDVPLALFKQDSLHKTLTDNEIKALNDKYTRAEIDNFMSGISTGLSWKAPVNSYSELLKKYPNPPNGTTVNVEHDPDTTKNGTYTYNESTKSWIKFSSSVFPLATTSINGLMSSTDKLTLNTVKKFVDNYKPPEVSSATINNLKNEINKKLEGYRPVNVLIKEKDVDPALIKKLSTTTLENQVTDVEISGWFAAVDPGFSWDNW